MHGFDVAVGVGRLVGEAGGGAQEGVGFETCKARLESVWWNKQYRVRDGAR